MEGAHTPPPGATTRFWRGFRRWRRARPFWGGLLLILAGIELFLSSNLDLGSLELHMGPTGFLSYVLPVALLLCGALVWGTPAQRLFYGIIGSLVAVYSLIGLNLGGFIIGCLLGIVGGALAVAWGPPKTPAEGDDPDTRDTDDTSGTPGDPPTEQFAGPEQPYTGTGENDSEDRDRDTRPIWHSAVAVPVALAAVLLGAGVHATSARAAPQPDPSSCPTSRATTPAGSASTRPAGRATPKPTASKPAGTPEGKPTAEPTPTPTPTPTGGTGNPLVDGWNDFVEGVEDFFNPDAEPTGEPTGEPTSGATTPPAPGTPTPVPGPKPGPQPGTQPTVTPPPGATPTPSKPEPWPCLGEALIKKAKAAADQPAVALNPGLLTTANLVMDNSVYQGVVDLPTAGGTMKVLKFTMTKAVNTPFRLDVAEKGDTRTVVTSTELTTQGAVTFFTPRMKGTLMLFDIIPIPVEFTPEHPPPLTLPRLRFTEVSIDLAFINAEELIAKTMKISVETGNRS